MNESAIYTQLRSSGMTAAGACAVMGNFQAESAMIANNAEDRIHSELGISDAEYTAAVDNGSYTKFGTDRYGYGLYQLTLPQRKKNYLAFVKARGESIGSASAQVAFCIKELKEDFASLWTFLCTTDDIATATSRVCKEFERPAVNNIKVRTEFANKFYAAFASVVVDETKAESNEPERLWPPRVICEGMSGEDVAVLQAILVARGYTNVKVSGAFDNTTKIYVLAFQGENGLATDGIVGPFTWSKLLER